MTFPYAHLVLGLGGFLGTVFRFSLGSLVSRKFPSIFPLGTLTVNLVGSFAIGFLVVLVTREVLSHPGFRLFFIVGFLGGFTTYSSFSLETYQLLAAGKWKEATLYATGTFFFGLALTALGVFLAMRWTDWWDRV